LRFEWHFLNWKHRVMFDPRPDIEPNPGGIFRSVYGTVLEPFDLANTQLAWPAARSPTLSWVLTP
jgi:hypothetical protein